jgi:UDP-N-acetylglucosamine 4,6-dehydratase
MFNNTSILITGGTGSFGYAFVEKLLKNYKPRKIVIFSRDEFKQYQMSDNFKDKRLRFFIGDVRDRERINLAMNGIDLVLHAAALKHVPAAEYNPMEFVKTNVLGAENVIFSALNNNVKKIIALSTDKASNPINLYGATKLLSDKIFVSSNNIVGKKDIRFSVVRYGNVFNSRGSIFPLFQKIVDKNEKHFPITHPEMTRFVITLSEGVDFVIQSYERMHGGEIFIPKIKSLRILDLAKVMDNKKMIKFIGIRPGEKLHESLFSKDESALIYEYKNYYTLAPSISFGHISNEVYIKNKLGERGKKKKFSFDYISNNNVILEKHEIKKIIESSNTDK